MLLHRLKKHIREQNWFAVGLDFIVVVAGIFIGLQVNNWNEDRKDRHEETAYMERLLLDAEYNIGQLETVIRQHQARADRATEALSQLTHSIDSIENVELTVLHLMLSVDIASVRLTTGTYDELVSAGKLGLIRDVELKKLLQAEAGAHRYIRGSLQNFRNLQTSPSDHAFKHYAFSFDQKDDNELVISYDLESLRADKKFTGSVLNSIGAVRSFIPYRHIQLQSVMDVRNHLRCKLDKVTCSQKKVFKKEGL